MRFKSNFMSFQILTASFAQHHQAINMCLMCRKTKSETNFSQITYQINNFALNLGKAEDACPAMKFFEARC